MVELVKRTLHSARWQLLVLFVVFIESTRAQTYSNTSTQTLYSTRYKTICTCLMPGLEDSQSITCSNQPSGSSSSSSSGSGSGSSNNNLRINIINAYMFDSGKIGRNNCTLKSETFGLIKYITDELQLICLTSSNCSISKSFLINLVSDSTVIECLSTSIFYNCVSLSNTPNYTNPSYTFTYFFYIITLVLSSSCILIGALFILRRFLLIRRRTNYSDPNRPGGRRRHNRPAFGRGGRSEMGAPNEAGVWTTTANNIYPPPAYEQINDFQTVHMATPPPYDSAAIVKTKLSALDDPTSSSSLSTAPQAPVSGSSHAQPNDPNDLRSVVNTSFNMDELDDLQVTSQQTRHPVNPNQQNESSSTKAE